MTLDAEAKKTQAFDQYLQEVSPTWTWHWPHLKFIREQLERITRGEIRYLIVSCPPRHGKSEQGTVRYPAWRIEQDPTCRVIVAAYNHTLARKFSRKIRRVATGRIQLSTERTAAEEWETTEGGGVRAAGVGTGVTGMGANLIVIDDPVKSRAEAESQVFRDRCWDWFCEDLYSRQEPGCSIVLTMTRWHEDDLAGRILKSEFASDWSVVNLPALAEENDPLGRAPGVALCPDRFNEETLAKYRTVMKRNFYALYQGSPRPAEGNKFKRGWFRYWTRDAEHPELLRLARDDGRTRLVRLPECRIFVTVDLAVSTRKAADYTVFAVWAVTPLSDLVLIDLVREQMEEPDVLRVAAELFGRYRPQYLAVETSGLGLPIVQAMRRSKGLPIKGLTSHLDKIARASTAIVRTEAGQVFWPQSAPWLDAFELELLEFPGGVHDDQVDALSYAAEDVFWQGAPESDTVAEIREQVAALEQEEEYRSIDNDDWWDR